MSCKNNYVLSIIYVVVHLCFYVTLCGRVKRVVGGMEVDCGYQPRVASLQNVTSSQHLCGVTVLSPQYAVTAAHCVHHASHHYQLQFKNFCTDEAPPIGQVLNVITHELYDKYTRAHDIAILRIRVHLDDITWLNDNILPNSSFGVSGECAIYGYGVKDLDISETSEKLLTAKVKIISMDECNEKLGPYVAPSWNSGMMCAVGDGADTCQGDSGGPIMCRGSIVEGVSSHGLSCGAPGVPAVYTSIGAHLRWIRDVMRKQQCDMDMTII